MMKSLALRYLRFPILGVSALTAMLAAPVWAADPVPRCSPWELPDPQDDFCKVAGSWIGDLDGVSYGLEQQSDGKQHKLVFEVQPSESQGLDDWKAIDELYLKVRDDQFLMLGVCRLNGEMDNEIFATVSSSDEDLYVPAVKAWRADRKLRKIISIPARGVDCEVDRCE